MNKRTMRKRCGLIAVASLAGALCIAPLGCEQQPSPGPGQPAARTPKKTPGDATVSASDSSTQGTRGAGRERPVVPGEGGVAPGPGPQSVVAIRGSSASSPPSSSPPPSAPQASGASNDAEAQFAGMTAPKPVTWQYRAPPATSTMRVAEYVVPGVEGSNQAQIVVFQFPGGGSVEENINRWKGQVQGPDGKPAEPKVETFEVDGMTVTVAELAGAYRGMGMSAAQPDSILIASMIQGDGDPVFVQLSGPDKTVDANREAFLTMLRGLKKTEPMK